MNDLKTYKIEITKKTIAKYQNQKNDLFPTKL